MSVAGYLSQGKGNSELRMPDTTTDMVGAEYAGDVLSGRISVEQRQAADSAESLAGLLERLGLRAGPWVLDQYAAVDEYDPVLRWHCRL
jgi:hypothetical protein